MPHLQLYNSSLSLEEKEKNNNNSEDQNNLKIEDEDFIIIEETMIPTPSQVFKYIIYLNFNKILF